MAVEVTKIQNLPKNQKIPKKAKKTKICQKNQNYQKKAKIAWYLNGAMIMKTNI
jgi:predicted nucleic acid-binding Zn ribbon protein